MNGGTSAGSSAPAFERDYFERYGGRNRPYGSRRAAAKWASMCRFIARFDPRPNRALDFGCAEGDFLAHARTFFPRTQWIGADVSRYAVERARQRLRDVELIPADEISSIAGRSLDLVTAFDVLEHIADLDGVVGELARVLRPGGVLVAVVPVYDGPVGWLVRLLDRDPTHLHKEARRFWIDHRALCDRFDLVEWHGAWRYQLGWYWHARGEIGRDQAPAIVMAWRLRR